jgi:hypothetical protein
MAKLLEHRQPDPLFEERLAFVSRRLSLAIQGFEIKLHKSQNQIQKVQLMSRLLTFGRYLPSAFAIGVSLLRLARVRPIYSILFVGIAGLWLNRRISAPESKALAGLNKNEQV